MRARTLLGVLVVGVLGVVIGGVVVAAPARAAAGPDPSITVALDRSTYRLGDLITGTLTITNRGDAPAAAVTVHPFYQGMQLEQIDYGEFRRVTASTGVLDRELAPGETVYVIVHGSATGFLLAPSSTTLTGRVDYTGDVNPNNNWDQVVAYYDTSGSTAVVSGTVFLDANRDGIREADEVGAEVASPSLWKSPTWGQGVGITADGRYSFTGIIGQPYELHFDVVDSTRYVGTTDRVYTFTLGAGGRTINYGVFDLNAPPPPSPSPTTTSSAPTSTTTATTTAPPPPGHVSGPAAAPGATTPHGAAGSPGDGTGSQTGSSTVAPTQPAPSATDSSAAAPEPDVTPTLAVVPLGDSGSTSPWPWLVGAVGFMGLVAAGWAVRRWRRQPGEPS